ncbi:MAG: amine oxidase [Micromonosporaceae bacterium]|nr:amine oxidase [Micromonosporaceae bacterium]
MVQRPPDGAAGASGLGRALPGQAGGRDESELERWDRNFVELLQELRVVQTGPQILLAFLLTVPFTNRFAAGDTVEKAVYVVTLLATASAAALLITPAAYHRRIFRQGRKAELVRVSTVLAELGLACLALAIVGTVFVAVDVVFGRLVAIAAGAWVAVLAVLLWYALPPLNKRRLYRRGLAAPGLAPDDAGAARPDEHRITAEPRDRPGTH